MHLEKLDGERGCTGIMYIAVCTVQHCVVRGCNDGGDCVMYTQRKS